MKRHGRETMIQRTMTVARGHVRALGNRAQDESTRQGNSLAQWMPQRQVRGNRRRQGATRAMHIATGNARRRQTLRSSVGLHQQIHHLITGQVTALEQHSLSLIHI